MQTQEERIIDLEKAVALLEKKFSEADIQNVNHNTTMLLGLVYKQQIDISVMKSNLTIINQQIGEIKQDVKNLQIKSDQHTSILDEHTAVLNEHTSILNEHTSILNEHTALHKEHTTALNENTKLLTQILALLTKHISE
ncbi:hypothetical protein KDA_21770 [Dictyobacter alpinus]|uniref:Uncharacterized protein n=1 Tax=Dictyobacter alpinus TaxID=2014873 RepID=A0A402B5R9_9CHLR|nr:hypothetical protein [Dictyobacter alpinus]GCE26693.1 hypothetical protein KDA_21770 [Dictyobacter alpinus]